MNGGVPPSSLCISDSCEIQFCSNVLLLPFPASSFLFLCSMLTWVPKSELYQGTRSGGSLAPVPVSSVFFFFFSCTHGMCKFPGQGLNRSQSCDLHHSYGNAGSLTHCAGPGIEPCCHRGKARSSTRCATVGTLTLSIIFFPFQFLISPSCALCTNEKDRYMSYFPFLLQKAEYYTTFFHVYFSIHGTSWKPHQLRSVLLA